MSDKNEIISSFGLDVSSTLLQWEGWCPNKKYSECVVISNLNTKTVNMCIQSAPKCKQFVIEPESSSMNHSRARSRRSNENDNLLLRIRGGHSIKIWVHFLPSEIKCYADELRLCLVPKGGGSPSISNLDDTINIALRADVPKTSVQIPSVLDFGHIAVKEEWTTTFQIANGGDRELEFEWQCKGSPLRMEPVDGVLAGNSTETISVSFSPQTASCLEMAVPLRIGGETMTMTVKATCSYPFLRISSKKVDLGAVSIGDCKRHKLRIENGSAVSAAIDIVADSESGNGGKMQSVFKLDPMHCRIASNGSVEVVIEFRPRTVGVRYTQHCCIETRCGYKVRFEINGKADEPKK